MPNIKQVQVRGLRGPGLLPSDVAELDAKLEEASGYAAEAAEQVGLVNGAREDAITDIVTTRDAANASVAETAADANVVIDGKVATATTAATTALGAQTAAQAASVAARPAISREPDSTPSLWRDQFKSGNAGAILTSTGGMALASNFTDYAVGLDCGAGLDIEPGILLDAVWTELAVGGTAARIDVTIYERDIAAATTAGTLNTAPPVAQDTAVGGGTASFAPAAFGITPGASGLATPTAPLLSPIYTISGKCYVVRWEAFDASNARVAMAFGFKQVNTSVQPQRRVGWYKASLGTSTWTAQTNSAGAVRFFVRGFRRKALEPISARVSFLSAERSRQERMAFRRAVLDNDAELLAQSRVYSIGSGATYRVSGDSLNAQTFTQAGYPAPAASNQKSSDVVALLTAATVVNNANSGQRIDEIAAVINAEAVGATGKGATRHINGGTNDIGQTIQGSNVATIQQMHDRVVAIVGDGLGGGGIITTANWTFGTGRVGAASHSLNYGMARALLCKLRVSFGPKIYDLDSVNLGYEPASEPEGRKIRAGQIAQQVASDLTHWTLYGARAYGSEQARLFRALSASGAPYVHQEVIGLYDSSAAGTATQNENGGTGGTLILANTLFGVSCVSRNIADDVARLNAVTGAITRGAGAITDFGRPDMPPARDLLIRADGWGGGHVGRKALVRLMEGTMPLSAVRLVGNGGTSLVASEALAADGKELTLVWYFRLNNIDNNPNAQKGQLWQGMSSPAQSGATITATLRNAASSIITTFSSPKPDDPYGWQAMIFSIDALNGVAKIRVNGTTVVAGTVNNLIIPLASLVSLFGADTGLPIIGIDQTMLWMCDRYMDPADNAVFGTFFDLTTFVPKDIGGGAVTTIGAVNYQPFIHLFGTAGDYLTGRAQRVAGESKRMYPPLYSGAANAGFIDVAR